MLILSRRNGESFIIGEDIKITVLSQRSNQVRIGIDAPRELPVFREEVLDRRQQNANEVGDTKTGNSALKKNSAKADQNNSKRSEELVE